MIWEDEQLRELYEQHEFDRLLQGRQLLERLPDEKARIQCIEFQRAIWPDWQERLQKTSLIVTKDEAPRLLIFRPAQKRFVDDVIERCRREGRPVRGIILKARQLGFSTLIQCLHYFWCNENANRRSVTISYDDDSTEDLFEKAKFVHDNFPFRKPTSRARSNLLNFATPHNSWFFTVTAGNLRAGRGRTFQHLHCSEIPMWTDPETVMTGAQQGVPSSLDTSIFWESTARGAVGLFYDTWNASEASTNGMVPFFAPWFWEDQYSMAFPSDDHRKRFLKQLPPADHAFMKLYRLSAEQMQWRRFKIDNDLWGNEDSFKQEFPSCAEEAFLTTGSPAFNAEAIAALSRQCSPPVFIGDAMMVRR